MDTRLIGRSNQRLLCLNRSRPARMTGHPGRGTIRKPGFGDRVLSTGPRKQRQVHSHGFLKRSLTISHYWEGSQASLGAPLPMCTGKGW